MYDKQVYEDLRKSNPRYFDIANDLYNGVLTRRMLIVRALVTRALENNKLEIAQIEVIDLECLPRLTTPTTHVLSRLCFHAEVNFKDNKVEMLETSLQMDGPMWNEEPLRKKDVVNQLAVFIHEWRENETLISNDYLIFNPQIDSASSTFSGYLALSNNLQVRVPAYHPVLLPFISLCLGSFNGSLEKKIAAMQKGSGTMWSARVREEVVHSFARRFGSFVVQAQRENARNCFGSFLAS